MGLSLRKVYFVDHRDQHQIVVHSVDIVAGNSTDGQIRALDLFHLEDDLSYFPPYEAIPVVRSDALELYPQLVRLLDDLENTMDEPAMIELNYLVDVQRRNVREVAGEFLDRIWAD